MNSFSSVAVIFGGPSPEHDVSILTGLQAARGLKSAGMTEQIKAFYWAKSAQWYEVDPFVEAEAFLQGLPDKSRKLNFLAVPEGGFFYEGGFAGFGKTVSKKKSIGVDVVLNCCHGGPGEDGTLQAALTLAGVPYTGPSVAGAVLGMDKMLFWTLVHSAGLPALPRISIPPIQRGEKGQAKQDPSQLNEPEDIGFFGDIGPFIVKPRFGGSSIGIEVVEDLDTARALVASTPHFMQGAVVEPYRNELFDLQIGVRTWPKLEFSAIERPFRASSNSVSFNSGILGYADKYVSGEGMLTAPRELPAKLSQSLEHRLLVLATRVALLSEVRSVARIDFLSDGNELYINEINTIPGSLTRHLWVDPPISFEDILSDMLSEAISIPMGMNMYTTQGADGTALRKAGSIASKLA